MKLSRFFAACLLAITFSSVAVAQTAVEGQPSAPPMVRHPADHRHQIIEGIEKINHAYQHLERAGDEWGGHRATAMQDLAAARQELQIALDFENQQFGR